MEEERRISFEKASEFSRRNGLLFVESSSKESKNVEQAFIKITARIIDRIDKGIVETNDENGIKRSKGSISFADMREQEKEKRCCSMI